MFGSFATDFLYTTEGYDIVMQPFSADSSRQEIPVYQPIRQRVHRPGDIIVIIKVYFDGTGRFDTKFMGLAEIAAPVTAWEAFESGWSEVLRRYQVPSLHMTDLNVSRGMYQGWSLEATHAFLRDLLVVLYALLRMPQTVPRMTIIPVSQHRQATQAYPGVIPSIPCLCVFWCWDEMCASYSPEDHFEMLFDRNEPFFHQVNRHWQRKSFAKTHHLLRRVVRLGLDDAERLLPLQAADLFVWEIHKFWQTSPEPTYARQGRLGALEAEWLLLSTHNKRWEYDDLEYLA
jgi:hypothetical protein